MIPWERGFDACFSFKFCRNIQQTSGMCYNLHRALSWVKQEEVFFFHFFAGFFFGRRLCRSDLKHLVQNLQNQISYLDSSRKITQFQKKNGSNRSPEVGDIADLKSAILSEFL